MKWNFDGPNGGITIRQEGTKAICQAISGAKGGGPYKAWLKGPAGKILLGTLIPEGGSLRLRRVMDISQLESKGAWPPAGAEISAENQGTKEAGHPGGWQWMECPARLMGDKEVAQLLNKMGHALYKKDEKGFFLAIPYGSQTPYPLPSLFCLSRLQQINDQWYAVFSFSSHGYPRPMYNSSTDGENRGVT